MCRSVVRIKHGTNTNGKKTPSKKDLDEETSRMGQPYAEGHGASRGQRKQASSEKTSSCSPSGTVFPMSEKTEYPHRIGPRPRVPRPEELDELEDRLSKAFQEGDLKEVQSMCRQLLELTRKAVDSAAEARFRLNLGTTACEHCDGLKAGVDVVSTCFQLKRCFYGNRKVSDMSTKQQRLVAKLANIKFGKGQPCPPTEGHGPR